jgi:histone H3/H4
MAETWLVCSACRTDIPYGGAHYVCSVSTCNRRATRLVFCSVACWDSHVATLRHREAWAVDARAPSKEAWAREQAEEAAAAAAAAAAPAAATTGGSAAARRVVGDASPTTAAAAEGLELKDAEREILIVVSKLKKYIKDRAGFNCSDAVADQLSEHVRAVADESIRAAAREGRKTVLDRDVPKARR